MVKVIAFLKLVRFQNLLIVAFTMILMRYAIVEPILGYLPLIVRGDSTPVMMNLQLGILDFIILVASTLSITAAGYVINDYFDIRTDLVNRGKVIVGTKITRRKAMMWHNILSVIGVIGGFYVSYKIGYFWLGIFFILVSGLLFFYSATYKRQLLIGNVIVSILTAAVPFMVVAYELPPVYRHYVNLTSEMPSLTILLYWVGGFSVFAFITSLAREIVKDIEDFEGDKAFGSNSLPVALGIKWAKVVVLVLLALIIVLLLFVWYFHLNDTLTLVYIGFGIITPLLISGFYVVKSSSQQGMHKGSLWLKIVMLAGICYSLVVLFIINNAAIG